MEMKLTIITCVFLGFSAHVWAKALFSYFDIKKQVPKLANHFNINLGKEIHQAKITWVSSSIIKDERCGYIKILELNNTDFSSVTFDSNFDYLKPDSSYSQFIKNAGIKEIERFELRDIYSFMNYKLSLLSKLENGVIEYRNKEVYFNYSFLSVLRKSYLDNKEYSIVALISAIAYSIFKIWPSLS